MLFTRKHIIMNTAEDGLRYISKFNVDVPTSYSIRVNQIRKLRSMVHLQIFCTSKIYYYTKPKPKQNIVDYAIERNVFI